MYNQYQYMDMYNRQYPQPIQQVSQRANAQALCYFVKSPEEFKVDVLPGIFYLGINIEKDEVYIKRINNEGNTVTGIYTKLAKCSDNLADRIAKLEEQLKKIGERDADTRTDTVDK